MFMPRFQKSNAFTSV